ncbi:hypothetical protein N9Z08_02850, partial [Pirellulales bacterium]|nr:hypothetical protein [Pirellulales bacterium]
SDDLIGVFYNQDDALYATNLQRAWAGQSDNLYTLLQLNQRFPGGYVLDPGTGTISYQISNMTMQAMMRVVGFPFEGFGPHELSPSQAVDGPDNPKPNGYNLKWLIFSKKNQEFIETNPEGNPFIDWKGLNIEVPTIEHFFEFTNNPINGRDQSGHGDTGGTPVGPLPSEVLVKLQNHYTDVGPNKKNVVEIFSEISGISNLSSLLLYPNLVNDIDGKPVGDDNETLQNVQVYDAKNVQLKNQDAATINPTNYGIYQEASEDIGGYYNTWDTALLGSAGQRTQVQVTSFFNEFVASRLIILEGENNGETPDQAVINSTIDELAIGLRALMALAYDASPLWTGYGIGFANAANPMVGKTLSEIQSPDSFIDYFNGQEIQLRNILVPSKSLIVAAQDPLPLLGAQYTTNGWFDLASATKLSGFNPFNPQAYPPGFTDNYEIDVSNTTVFFNPTTLSSDTISAAAIPDLSAGTLTPDSLIDYNGTPTALRELEPILSQTDVLPDNFATFISTAGGVDRVTGSKFSDVIVGPSHHAKHGRLTVSAGAGADVVIPGRGGSLVELGPDSDTIVIRRGDLFGTTNLLDFKASEDTIVYDKSTIKAFIDTNDANTLILTDRFGGSATKTLRLTPLNSNGDLYWKQEFLDSLSDSDQAGNFNYLETHTFVDSKITDLSNELLRISSVINSNENPNQLREGDTVSVSIGDVQIFPTAQHDALNDEIYVSIPLQNFITKGSNQKSDIAQELISSESFTVSVVPLRSIDSEFELISGQFNQTISNTNLRSDGGKVISIAVNNIDEGSQSPLIKNWFEKAGSEMYLFTNVLGEHKVEKIIGKVLSTENYNWTTKTGTIDVYIYPNTDAAITKDLWMGWKYATEANSTAQQLQIFVSRQNGGEDNPKFDKIIQDEQGLTIKASDVNNKIAMTSTPTEYNFAIAPPSGVTHYNTPFSEWRVLPGSQEIAYMGGLANFIYSNGLHYSSSTGNLGPDPDRPIEITIDEDLFPGSGSGKVNLSSNFSVFYLPQGQDPQAVCNALNQHQTDSLETGNTQQNPTGTASTLPTGMPTNTQFKGTHSLATKSQIFINGTGRINLANVTNNDQYKLGAKNRAWGWDQKTKEYLSNSHPDWASNIYYTIGTDIITASSTHKKETGDTWAPSITATGFTAAWPMIKGIGGVRFQEFDSIGLIKPNGVELKTGAEMRELYQDFTFYDSSVYIKDFKQVGGWNWQADGPQIGGWGSTFINSFIHANDDSLKFGAPNLTATHNTILQGSAGVSVGTSYGYVNGGFQSGKADGVFVHRVTTQNGINYLDNAVGLVSAWASPVPEYFYELGPQTLSVKNVFVPNLTLDLYQKSTNVTKPTPQEKWDLNHISIGANVYFEDSVRGFSMTTQSQDNFYLQLGPIDMYENWRINTHVETPNTVAIGKTTGPTPVEATHWEHTSTKGTSPIAYRVYPKGLESLDSHLPAGGNFWQMVSQTTVTGPQWNNDVVQTPLYQPANSPTITVTTVDDIKLFSQDGKLTRPELKRATKIRLNRDSNVIGPQPIRLMHSHIEDAVNANPASGETHSFIIANVASGKVEKKVGTTWIDVNAPLKTSSPLAIIAWLNNRTISPGDELRYVVETEDQGEVTARAFELIGWDGSSISEERTSVEIDASGWQDF